MNLSCANCHAAIKSENVNISTDLAKCDKCDTIHKASDLINTIKEKDLRPPSGSKISMEKGYDRSFEFTYPKKGFSLSLIPLVLFALFWLGFISFWTWGAARGSVIFALFSIPFWLFGVNMIVGIINSVSEVQIITLSKYTLKVQRQRPIRPKSFETDLQNIQSIKMKGMKLNTFSAFGNIRCMMKMQRSFGTAVEVPAIITGQKTEYFFDDANDAEQEWIASTLDSLVKGMKK